MTGTCECVQARRGCLRRRGMSEASAGAMASWLPPSLSSVVDCTSRLCAQLSKKTSPRLRLRPVDELLSPSPLEEARAATPRCKGVWTVACCICSPRPSRKGEPSILRNTRDCREVEGSSRDSMGRVPSGRVRITSAASRRRLSLHARTSMGDSAPKLIMRATFGTS